MFFKNIHYGLWKNYTAFSDTVWHKFNKNEDQSSKNFQGLWNGSYYIEKQKFHTIPSLSL